MDIVSCQVLLLESGSIASEICNIKLDLNKMSLLMQKGPLSFIDVNWCRFITQTSTRTEASALTSSRSSGAQRWQYRRSSSPSAPFSQTPILMILSSLRLLTCIRHRVLATRRQLGHGPRSMPWANLTNSSPNHVECLLSEPWRSNLLFHDVWGDCSKTSNLSSHGMMWMYKIQNGMSNVFVITKKMKYSVSWCTERIILKHQPEQAHGMLWMYISLDLEYSDAGFSLDRCRIGTSIWTVL